MRDWYIQFILQGFFENDNTSTIDITGFDRIHLKQFSIQFAWDVRPIVNQQPTVMNCYSDTHRVNAL